MGDGFAYDLCPGGAPIVIDYEAVARIIGGCDDATCGRSHYGYKRIAERGWAVGVEAFIAHEPCDGTNSEPCGGTNSGLARKIVDAALGVVEP